MGFLWAKNVWGSVMQVWQWLPKSHTTQNKGKPDMRNLHLILHIIYIDTLLMLNTWGGDTIYFCWCTNAGANKWIVPENFCLWCTKTTRTKMHTPRYWMAEIRSHLLKHWIHSFHGNDEINLFAPFPRWCKLFPYPLLSMYWRDALFLCNWWSFPGQTSCIYIER